MKTFSDLSNTRWTVFEVRRQVSERADWSYLPSGYNDGWLCFENASAKRRLVAYPAHWRDLSDAELADLLERALPAPRSSLRLSDDFGDTAMSPDAGLE
jgi:hypothetical protein